MTSRLTRKINGKWDWNSLEGNIYPSVICHRCGSLVKEAWQGAMGWVSYCFCENCFGGDKETALKTWIGEVK